MITQSIKVCCVIIFLFILCIAAFANDDCAELLTRELSTDERFQAYLSDLLQEGVLGRAQLKAYRKNLKKGVIANPVTESVAASNYEALVHRDSLQEYVDSGELKLEGQLAWTKKKLRKLEYQRTRKREVSEELREMDIDVTSRQWWKKATDRQLKYIDPHEEFVGKNMKVIDTSTKGITAVSFDKMKPLHFAAEYAPYRTVKKYLEIHREELDVDARNEWEKTALFRAILNRDSNVVKLLVSKGAKVDAEDFAKNTPLHWACEYEKAKMVEALVTAGADTNAKNRYNWAPLHRASIKGDAKVVKNLLSPQTDINAKSPNNEIPLHKASAKGHAKVVKLLLAAGADVHAKDLLGDTPLHRASVRGHTKVVEILLAAGADVHIKNSSGQTPADQVFLKGDTQILELLNTYPD